MDILPEGLEALKSLRQFIIWKPVWCNDANKILKRPCSPLTGHYFNHTKSEDWVTHEEAIKAAKRFGDEYHVGFDLTKESRVWCIDIDHCYKDGVWSETAIDLCNRFNGAYIEVSFSGDGLHIMGIGDTPDHKTNNAKLGVELYSCARFIAITGTNATGSIEFDHQNNINWLCDNFFDRIDETKNAVAWNKQRNPHWRGPESDEELIAEMMKAKSTAGRFGGVVCTVKDLWNNNETVIASCYPTANDKDPYDRSLADAALCMQLAWWTGNDCERVERLFNMSSLVREKWTKRAEYRHDTITKAAAQCIGCLGEEKGLREGRQIQWEPSQVEEVITNETTTLSGPRIIAFNDRPRFFQNHFYIASINKVLCPDGVTRNMAEYNGCYGNYEFMEQFASQKPLRDPWKAFVLAPDIVRNEAHGTCYKPQLPYFAKYIESGLTYVNIHKPSDLKAIEGDAKPFLNHISKIYENELDQTILLSFLAFIVQHPGKKAKWAPFLQGAEGCGKSIIGVVMQAILGKNNVAIVNTIDFVKSGGKFNAWAATTRLALFEELPVTDRKQTDGVLKRNIDHGRMEVQAKGVDQITKDVCFNVIISSNDKDSLPIGNSSRRYSPFFARQQTADEILRSGINEAYFGWLWNWLENENGYEICYYFLLNYQIPDQYNAATKAQRAPRTSSFDNAVDSSMSAVEEAVMDIINSGAGGTLNGWLSLNVVMDTLQREGVMVRSKQQVSKVIERFGYTVHPAFEKNRYRTNSVIMSEGGKRVKLYLKQSHSAFKLLTGQEVENQYQSDQNYPVSGVAMSLVK